LLLTLTSKFLQQIARFQLSRGVTDTALLLPGPTDIIYQSIAGGDWVSHSTSGEAPEESGSLWARAHVINDKMFVLTASDMTRNKIYTLDLNNLDWRVVVPRNDSPVVITSRECITFTSWVHGGYIYFFGGGCSQQGCDWEDPSEGACKCGGASNLLIRYNTAINTWDLPLHGGEVPSPRGDALTIIAPSGLYLFGGTSPYLDYMPDTKLNDLYNLDMRSMIWRKVHGNCDEAPKLQTTNFDDHTLTKISGSSAVLYGRECWLLSLDTARQLQEPTSIWTEIQTPFPREGHASVLEPASKRHLVIGGWDLDHPHAGDVIKMTFNVVQLKTLAMDAIARNMDTYGERLTSNYPKKLRGEIMDYAAKMDD